MDEILDLTTQTIQRKHVKIDGLNGMRSGLKSTDETTMENSDEKALVDREHNLEGVVAMESNTAPPALKGENHESSY